MPTVLSCRRGPSWAGLLAALVGLGGAGLAARPLDDDLAATLERAAAQVQEFFTRAQSLVVTETVYIQPLGSGLTGDGPGRTVESELRLSWSPEADGDGATEAQTLRNVVKVNGHAPRAKDPNNCTTPEQHDTETQVLSMLLPQQRGDYTWTLAGRGKVDGRVAIHLDFREKAAVTVDVKLLETNKDCVSYNVTGGMRGRLWIDAETFDVLRMDQHLMGLIDVPLPRELTRRHGTTPNWTMERYDTTHRFRRVHFDDPDETIVLPISTTVLRITRGAGQPRTRIITEYKKYRRFLTGGRVVPGD